VGRREAIVYFRDAILHLLENIGTDESWKAIEKIAGELPELDWLKSILVEAKKNTMSEIWSPLTPEQFLAMATRKGTSLKKEIIEVKPGVFGMTVNIKEIVIRVWKYICSKDWWRRGFRRG